MARHIPSGLHFQFRFTLIALWCGCLAVFAASFGGKTTMITVRLTPEYERKIAEMAKKEGLLPGPYVRRLLIAHVESDGDGEVSLDAKLNTIERGVATILRETLKNSRKVDAFLDAAEIV